MCVCACVRVFLCNIYIYIYLFIYLFIYAICIAWAVKAALHSEGHENFVQLPASFEVDETAALREPPVISAPLWFLPRGEGRNEMIKGKLNGKQGSRDTSI